MNVWPADFVFDQLTTAFEASQHFTRGEVVRRQTALIERLIRHADTQVPFYRELEAAEASVPRRRRVRLRRLERRADPDARGGA